MATNVPLITWQNGAPVLPSESSILSGVFADINAAFGGGLNNQSSSPQGQLAASETAVIGDKNNQIAYIANQVNPTFSSGQWQDAIGQLYFMTRIASAGTVVSCTCVGAVGTVIPLNATAQDSAGYLYSSTAAATIGATGSVTVQFQNQTPGAIACPAGTLTKIYSAIPGWDTITNPTPGSLGNLTESRAAFESRRKSSVAANAVNSNSSILGAVLAVSGVIDAFVYDNYKSIQVSYGSTNYNMAPNSVTVSVAGGAAIDVANAIWNKKSLGCSFNGNTTVVITDTNYPAPAPTYNVTFLVPSSIQVYFVVNIKNIPSLPSNAVTLIQAAIVQSFYGNDGGIRAGIGRTTYAGRYYQNVNIQDPNIDVLSITMGTSAATATFNSLSFGIDQIPVTSTANVVVNLI